MASSDDTDHVLEETKEYYRQRASQYSDWSHRTDSWEQLDFAPDDSWFSEAQILIEALKSRRLTGDVLEIASGTGEWTDVLARTATSVTALDSSAEMHERSRSRLAGNPKVKYIIADIYDWIPDKEYDSVTFSFWLSHVPGSKLDEFASKVSDSLKPGGTVFFVDQQMEAIKYEILDRPDGEIATRPLLDGRQFRIVKHFYTTEEIERSFLRQGIKIDVSNTATHFFYASGAKPSNPSGSP